MYIHVYSVCVCNQQLAEITVQLVLCFHLTVVLSLATWQDEYKSWLPVWRQEMKDNTTIGCPNVGVGLSVLRCHLSRIHLSLSQPLSLLVPPSPLLSLPPNPTPTPSVSSSARRSMA